LHIVEKALCFVKRQRESKRERGREREGEREREREREINALLLAHEKKIGDGVIYILAD